MDNSDKEMSMGDEGDIQQEMQSEDMMYPPPPPTPRESQTIRDIYGKKYEEGDGGKMEAIRDLQIVFDELHEQKVISARVDLMAMGQTQPEGPTPSTARKRFTTTKSVALTPRIPINLKNKGFSSEQNLIRGQNRMKEPTTSLPILPTPIPTTKQEDTEIEKTAAESVAKCDTSVSFRLVHEDLEIFPTVQEGDDSDTDDGNEQQIDPEDAAWRADLDKLTRLKSASNVSTHGSFIHGEGETLELKYKPPVWPHQLALNQILGKIPTLTSLILDGSKLQCLRDLGSSLPSLVILSVARCELESLDGTAALSYLRTMVASNNNLEHAIQCSYLTELNHLDLSSNPIQDVETFAHLKACTKLRSLKLYLTPVSRQPNFYQHMKYFLPKLKELQPTSEVGTWNKSKVLEIIQEDNVQKIMRNEFEVIYKNNFEKTRASFQDKSKGGNDGVQDNVIITTTDGTTTETDDNFEKTLIKSIRMTRIQDPSSDSFSIATDGSGGDNDLFFSAENSETEIFQDCDSSDASDM